MLLTYLYLPSIGLSLILVGLIAKIGERATLKSLAYGIYLAFLTIFVYQNYHYQEFWAKAARSNEKKVKSLENEIRHAPREVAGIFILNVPIVNKDPFNVGVCSEKLLFEKEQEKKLYGTSFMKYQSGDKTQDIFSYKRLSGHEYEIALKTDENTFFLFPDTNPTMAIGDIFENEYIRFRVVNTDNQNKISKAKITFKTEEIPYVLYFSIEETKLFPAS
jgi:hypothetical protein